MLHWTFFEICDQVTVTSYGCTRTFHKTTLPLHLSCRGPSVSPGPCLTEAGSFCASGRAWPWTLVGRSLLVPFAEQGWARPQSPSAQPPPTSPHQAVCPASHLGAGQGTTSCRRAGEGGAGPAPGSGCGWLTCLVALGNGCLGKVLDFPILLQETLQKPGGFWDRNAKAGSEPLLPCTSRNTRVRGSDSHEGPSTSREAVPVTRTSEPTGGLSGDA